RAPPTAGWFFKKYPDLEINHIQHAGKSVDASAAILPASPSCAKKHGLKPRAKVVEMAPPRPGHDVCCGRHGAGHYHRANVTVHSSSTPTQGEVSTRS